MDPGERAPPRRKEITTETVEYKRAVEVLSRYYQQCCRSLLDLDSEITTYSISLGDVIPFCHSEIDELREKVEQKKENASRCYGSLTDMYQLKNDGVAINFLDDADTEDPLVTMDGRIHGDIVRELSRNYINSEEARRQSDRLLTLRSTVESEWNTLEREIQQIRNSLLTAVIATSSLITIFLTALNLFVLG